jgi:CO/xanthine dehydrogenase FAD-binding subunit
VEDAFKGKEISVDLFNDIAEKSAEEVNRLAGIRWSSEYKIPVLKGLIMRTLEQLSER